jgi:hypothetical protein
VSGTSLILAYGDRKRGRENSVFLHRMNVGTSNEHYLVSSDKGKEKFDSHSDGNAWALFESLTVPNSRFIDRKNMASYNGPSGRRLKNPGKVPTIYQALKAAGARIENHESDLYVLATPKVLELVKRHPAWNGNGRMFKSEGKAWLEIPFAYDPFWQAKDGIRGTRKINPGRARAPRDDIAARELAAKGISYSFMLEARLGNYDSWLPAAKGRKK